jgi:hypothetical protein
MTSVDDVCPAYCVTMEVWENERSKIRIQRHIKVVTLGAHCYQAIAQVAGMIF